MHQQVQKVGIKFIFLNVKNMYAQIVATVAKMTENKKTAQEIRSNALKMADAALTKKNVQMASFFVKNNWVRMR